MLYYKIGSNSEENLRIHPEFSTYNLDSSQKINGSTGPRVGQPQC